MGVATRSEHVVPKLVPSRPRHPQPIAYVVPLVERAVNARAFLVAITSWLTDDDLTVQAWDPTTQSDRRCTILEALRVYAAGFGCDDRAFAEGVEVVRARLGTEPGELPTGLFARDDVAGYPWATGSTADFLQQFLATRAGSAYVAVVSPSCFVLRSGEQPTELDQAFPKGAPFWHERPATQVVDLDLVFRMNAIAGLRAVLGDLVPASGSLAFERAILDGRAHKWNGAGFSSTEATRESYQRDRLDSIDRLGSNTFRLPVASQRWQFVGPAVRRRARESRHSIADEVTEGRRRNLGVVLPEIVAEEIGQYEQAIMASPPWPLPRYAAAFEAFREGLTTRIRRALNAAFTEDYLDDPQWRRQLTGSHVVLDRARAADPALRVEASLSQAPKGTIQEVLAARFGRTLLTRANLTPMQEAVVAAVLVMEPGDTLADWARRSGMNPKTVHVHLCNARKRLDGAMKLP
ncbi:MAG: hypothetical protein AB7S39_10170 [Gemmatimonadales bacterium]